VFKTSAVTESGEGFGSETAAEEKAATTDGTMRFLPELAAGVFTGVYSTAFGVTPV
jgi:hypothetical protein